MNKEEIENKIEEIFKRNTEVVKTKTKNGELWESFIFTEGFAEELSTLIQESNREAVKDFTNYLKSQTLDIGVENYRYFIEGFINGRYEKYLSSIEKDKNE